MSDRPWFEEWFGEEYLELYPHRDRTEAEAAVELLIRVANLGPRSRVLDLACGAGRHLLALEARGISCVGLDLSLPLLRRARSALPDRPLLQGDMRALPLRAGSFRAVSSFFTSFGYFDRERDDLRVLEEVVRVLRPDGHLFLDFLNAEEVRRGLRPRDAREVGDRRIVQERRLVDRERVVEKRIRVEGSRGEGARTFRERVRLYAPEELEALLDAAGLVPEARFGGYDGTPFEASSPRLILVARNGTPSR